MVTHTRELEIQTWNIHKQSKFKKRDPMLNTTQSALNGRVPPDAREACRDLLYYLRKRPELVKKQGPRGFKVSILSSLL